MKGLKIEDSLQAYALLCLGIYITAWAFSAGPPIYFLITVLCVTSLATIIWLYVSISVGKFLVSTLVDTARAGLALPFKLIRASPRLIRLTFFEAPVVLIFFLWFRLLVFFDRHILRRVLYWAGGLKHASGFRISTVNVISPSFSPVNQLKGTEAENFDLRSALSLSNLAKLAYEDEEVVRHELKNAGFTMEHFKTIQYHNTTGYICLHQGIVVLAFRGTEPLNLMHIMTDLQGGLVSLSSLDEEAEETDAGKAHYGFLEALRLHRSDAPKEQLDRRNRSEETIELDEEDTIGSAFTALFKIGGFMLRSFTRQPMTLKIPRSNGKTTAFQQITEALGRIEEQTEIHRIYCTGHSLGGALATVFFAQAQLSRLPKSLVSRMVVYSYGAPRIGDARLRAWFEETGAAKRVFKVVNAQDLVPRMPTLPEQLPKSLRRFPYSESPGTLVHIHPLSKDSPTLEEMPGIMLHHDGHLPAIEFWGLSGLLSLETIKKIRTERWLWIMARLWIPFVMFDHLASQYASELEALYQKSDDGHFEKQMLLR